MRAVARAERALQHRGAALVIDIDGTLADDAARRHLRPTTTTHCLDAVPLRKIERYMAPELVARDRPIRDAEWLLASLLASTGDPLVVMVTARWEPLRETTTRWLNRHFPWVRHQHLLMRSWGDHCRPAVDVKLELVLEERCGGGVWLDDDPRMLAAAKEHGFVPLKAPEVYWTVANKKAALRTLHGDLGNVLRRRDPRARLLAPTAPDQIPRGVPLCLCDAEESCVLCDEGEK